MNAEREVDYLVVLADMEAKYAGLGSAIAGMRLYLNGRAPASGSTGDSVAGAGSGEIPTGAFLGKSMPEAAILCLQIMKRKLSTREIADLLRKGGLESTSDNFQGIVHAALNRNRKMGGEIVKLERSCWGLAAWFPSGVRSAMANQEKRTTTKKHKRAKPKTQATAKPEKTKTTEKEAPPVVDANSGGTDDRIVAVLLAKPLAEYSPKEIAAAIGQKATVVAMRLGKLMKQQKAEKAPSGKYRAYTPGAQQMPLAS